MFRGGIADDHCTLKFQIYLKNYLVYGRSAIHERSVHVLVQNAQFGTVTDSDLKAS